MRACCGTCCDSRRCLLLTLFYCGPHSAVVRHSRHLHPWHIISDWLEASSCVLLRRTVRGLASVAEGGLAAAGLCIAASIRCGSTGQLQGLAVAESAAGFLWHSVARGRRKDLSFEFQAVENS